MAIAVTEWPKAEFAKSVTVITPPRRAKVMSMLADIAVMPLGASSRTSCVDGALLHASPEPTRIDARTRHATFGQKYANTNPGR